MDNVEINEIVRKLRYEIYRNEHMNNNTEKEKVIQNNKLVGYRLYDNNGTHFNKYEWDITKLYLTKLKDHKK